ncbi:MAG: 2,3-bisphosphoglycerate-independent phosphoglycerate mutase [Bacteroidales bacterium]|nr:2,3-bisphosphoglycerate-independent phosphoglycerate mutase [Bacteroidales bacterium]
MTLVNKDKVLLIILDGWGLGDHSKSDAIWQADTPTFDTLLKDYPSAQLQTCCNNVGLPDGQMGNSEVGHLNIGAGRIVFQDLEKINQAIRDNSIVDNEQIKKAFGYCQTNKKAMHFIGLLSDGGVHALNTHLYKLIDIAGEYQLEKVYIHVITDGRDTDPHSGLGFVEELKGKLKGTKAKIATLIGRYYTMDRDKRWERVKEGYDLMVNGIGRKSTDILEAVKHSYENGLTDEFIKASVMEENGHPVAKIADGDAVLCFNYRTDRLREITQVLTQQDMPEFGMRKLDLKYFTMTSYDKGFKNIEVVYSKEDLKNTLGEVVADLGLTQLRIAETEKYAHVTFFFSGGREKPFKNENRILVNSPKVATYDLQPEMSAFLVKDKLVAELNKKSNDFVVVNFANGDMVGHTGIYPAILKAAETIDQCIKEVVDAAMKNGYQVLLTADHGNADFAVNPDGTPNTAHSLNPVPVILISEKYKSHRLKDGILADIAPTILEIMGIDKPEEMSRQSLLS